MAEVFVVEATISGEGVWTDEISPAYTQDRRACNNLNIASRTAFGALDLAIYGDWSGEAKVQISYDSGVTWVDMESHTVNIFKNLVRYEPGVVLRAGMDIGGHASGECNIRLSK